MPYRINFPTCSGIVWATTIDRPFIRLTSWVGNVDSIDVYNPQVFVVYWNVLLENHMALIFKVFCLWGSQLLWNSESPLSKALSCYLRDWLMIFLLEVTWSRTYYNWRSRITSLIFFIQGLDTLPFFYAFHWLAGSFWEREKWWQLDKAICWFCLWASLLPSYKILLISLYYPDFPSIYEVPASLSLKHTHTHSHELAGFGCLLNEDFDFWTKLNSYS